MAKVRFQNIKILRSNSSSSSQFISSDWISMFILIGNKIFKRGGLNFINDNEKCELPSIYALELQGSNYVMITRIYSLRIDFRGITA